MFTCRASSILTKAGICLAFGALLISTSACRMTPGGTLSSPTNLQGDTVTRCSSDPPPAGHVKINDDWSPTSCGNPSSITWNVVTYQRYDNKALGTMLRVCSDQPVPLGWESSAPQWMPTRCGHPTSTTDNTILITRKS